MLYVWQENSMLTNCLAACAHLSITVSEIQRYIREKIGNFSYTLVFDASVRGVPIRISAPPLVWENYNGVAIWLWKNFEDIFIRFGATPEPVRQTDGHRVTAYTALMHMHRAVKITRRWYYSATHWHLGDVLVGIITFLWFFFQF